MQLISKLVLGLGLLSSLATAISLPPEGPQWVSDIQSYMEEHSSTLNPSQVSALANALTLAVTRDKKLAPEMKKQLKDAFGVSETAKLLTLKRDEEGGFESQADYCDCVPQVDYSCGSDETCDTSASCKYSPLRCAASYPHPCTGLCV